MQPGDANTKFFHAHATLNYRRNLITVLEDDSGQSISDHSAKADLVWSSFKERLEYLLSLTSALILGTS